MSAAVNISETACTKRQAATASQRDAPLSAARTGILAFIVIAVWIGLVTGLAEVGLVTIKKFAMGAYVHRGPHFVWMVPSSYCVIFGLIGISMGVVGRIFPRWVSLRTLLLVCLLLAFWILLLLTERFWMSARLILAAGLAVQMSSWLARHPAWCDGLVSLTLGWSSLYIRLFRQRQYSLLNRESGMMPSRRDLLVSTGAAVVGLSAGTLAWSRGLTTHSKTRYQVKPAAAGSPNLLFIVLDTVRAQSLSLYGYKRSTSPNLERLAKLGVRFDRAIATAPWTLPSHAGMFTGRFPTELSCDWTIPLDAAQPTLAEALAAHGYETAGFVGNNHYCSQESGLGRGFQYYEDQMLSPGDILDSSSFGRIVTAKMQLTGVMHDEVNRKSAKQVNESVLGWLSGRRNERPFFAFLNYYDAHDPYCPPGEFAQEFCGGRSRGTLDPNKSHSAIELRELRDAYDGAIASLDHHIGHLFSALEHRGALKNTLVVIVSDHGEHFGEHNLICHGNSLYMPLLAVPLVVLFPRGKHAGEVISETVSLRDLPTTVMNVLGLGDTFHFPGQSLLRFWPGENLTTSVAKSSPAFSERRSSFGPTVAKGFVQIGPQSSLICNNLHYIKTGNACEELYDLRRDPLEECDLAKTDNGRHELPQFRSALERMLVLARTPSVAQA